MVVFGCLAPVSYLLSVKRLGSLGEKMDNDINMFSLVTAPTDPAGKLQQIVIYREAYAVDIPFLSDGTRL